MDEDAGVGVVLSEACLTRWAEADRTPGQLAADVGGASSRDAGAPPGRGTRIWSRSGAGLAVNSGRLS